MKVHVDIARLRELYVDQRKSIPATALALGVSTTTVWKRLEAAGIPRRAKSTIDLDEMRKLFEDEGFTFQRIGDTFGLTKQAVHQRFRLAGIATRRQIAEPDRETLFRLYVTEQRSVETIARLLGVNPPLARKWLRRYDIKVREPGIPKHPGFEREFIYKLYVVDALRIDQIAAKLHVGKNIVSRELRRHNITHRHHYIRPPDFVIDRDELYRLYVEQGISLAVIGRQFGCVGQTIARRLKDHGIARRPTGKR